MEKMAKGKKKVLSSKCEFKFLIKKNPIHMKIQAIVRYPMVKYSMHAAKEIYPSEIGTRYIIRSL